LDPHLTELFLEDPQKKKNKIVRALIIILALNILKWNGYRKMGGATYYS
jgi:hypothetical protein